MPTRRETILAAAAVAAAPALAEAQPALLTDADRALLPLAPIEGASIELIPLWPEGPPGGPSPLPAQRIVERAPEGADFHDRAVEQVARPMLIAVKPAEPNGAAMLMAPGGGYVRIVLEKEGYETAAFFAARGVTTYILIYRLPSEGWLAGPDVSLQDAQRAMRLIRARAAGDGVDPARVAAMGFSAGGHVIGSLSLKFDQRVYEASDLSRSARPDASLLIYPVATMDAEFAHGGSRQRLLGAAPDAQTERAYSLEHLARADAPATFLIHASDDQAVRVENSLGLYHTLLRAGVPVEMHIFEQGGHGFGIRLAQGKPAAAWPELAHRWLVQRGLIPASP